MKDATKYSLVILILLVLSGCGDKLGEEEAQAKIQKEWDFSITKYELCYIFPVGSGNLPMIDLVDIDRNKPIFDLFAKKGLLKRQSIDVFNEEDNEPIAASRYIITSKGAQYYIYSNAFCFGKPKVFDIYNIEEFSNYYEVDYNFFYDNIPEWAKDSEFHKYYNIKIQFDGSSLLSELARFSTDGRLYYLPEHNKGAITRKNIYRYK